MSMLLGDELVEVRLGAEFESVSRLQLEYFALDDSVRQDVHVGIVKHIERLHTSLVLLSNETEGKVETTLVVSELHLQLVYFVVADHVVRQLIVVHSLHVDFLVTVEHLHDD